MRAGRLFVPEVVQTSAMDCGPACLKSLLEGFGIRASYDALRGACQTELDGTSIDTIEQVAVQMGLQAEQIMVPPDHLVLPEANILPALVVVRLPNSLAHFVIVWRRHGSLLQVMDPESGRQWPKIQSFLDRVHIHEHAVPAADWRQWATSEEFLKPLSRRGRRIHVAAHRMTSLIDKALADPHWRSIAALDAAIRMLTPMVQSGRIAGSETSGRVLEAFFERARSDNENAFEVIPPVYWSALPAVAEPEQEETLVFRGVVLIRVRGCQTPTSIADAEGTSGIAAAGNLGASLGHSAMPPFRQLLRFLREDGLLAPITLSGAIAVAATGVVFEAFLFRSLFDMTAMLGLVQQRLIAITMLVGFLFAIMFLDIVVAGGLLRAGRKLEIRLRQHLLHAIPRLSDRYFGSRLISDMAERGHAIHEVRAVPLLGGQLLHYSFQLLLTTAGIIWLDPAAAGIAAACVVFALALPVVTQPILAERDLRFRTHSGGLCRFYFDSLRGLIPARVHGAEDSIRREHESLLVTWASAGISVQKAAVALEGVTVSMEFGLTAWLVLDHIARTGDSAVALLLVYWGLNLPVLGRQIAQIAWQYPRQRNLAQRLLEPLGVAEDSVPDTSKVSEIRTAETAGVAVEIRDVSVRALGQTILEDVNVSIKPGSHVCVLGSSGAGKSSLAGLLLGWHHPVSGTIHVDGHLLGRDELDLLRQQTAWVDPSVQIWNRSLLANLAYGLPAQSDLPPIAQMLCDADLLPVVEKLPEGLQTRLGESGSLVSGGEGQRVRLGRAMLRGSARLVILDEPFTALDREQRRALLLRVKEIWRNATMLYITHDIFDSQCFERVLVLERGRIVEDGEPKILRRMSESRYSKLLNGERRLRERVWSYRYWRKLTLSNGRIAESDAKEHHDGQPEEAMLAGSAIGGCSGGAFAQNGTSAKTD